MLSASATRCQPGSRHFSCAGTNSFHLDSCSAVCDPSNTAIPYPRQRNGITVVITVISNNAAVHTTAYAQRCRQTYTAVLSCSGAVRCGAALTWRWRWRWRADRSLPGSSAHDTMPSAPSSPVLAASRTAPWIAICIRPACMPKARACRYLSRDS